MKQHTQEDLALASGGYGSGPPGGGGGYQPPPGGGGFGPPGGPPPNPYGGYTPGGGYPAGPPNPHGGHQRPPSNTVATIAAIGGGIGLGSTLCICIPCLGSFAPILMLLGSLVGIICGAIGIKTSKQMHGAGHGAALSGIITGVIALLGFIAILVLYIIYGAAVFAQGLEQPPY